MRVVADGAAGLFVFEGSMDEFFFGNIFMAIVTELGSRRWGGKGMAVSISFVTEFTSIITFGQGTVDEGTGAEVRMALLGQAGASWFDGLWCLALLPKQNRDPKAEHP